MNFTKLTVYSSTSNDPFKNLALENYIFSRLASNEKVLLFYVNKPCIVMGRFQNPWIECKLSKMIENDVSLVRRQSGGGTVYHDPGNLNFCFMQKTREHLKDDNNQILVNALSQLGIHAKASGRSDLIYENEGCTYKFSGSAFKQKKDRSFHHGTLLIDSDLGLLNDFLIPKDRNIQAKGIKSVRSKVINLSHVNKSLTALLLQEAIINSCKDFYKIEDVSTIPMESFYEHEIVNNYQQFLKNWDWMFGETPLFKLNITLKYGNIHFEVKKAIILKCECELSSVHPSLAQELSNALIGQSFKVNEIEKTFLALIREYPMFNAELSEIKEEIAQEIEL